MKFVEAKETLKFALNNQKSIQIKKLKEIMQVMNISLESSKDKEIQYLKGEIKNLRKRIRRLERRKND